MTFIYFDVSALVKRYVVERGTPVVNHSFTRVPLDRTSVLLAAAGEVVSVLVRRRNAGSITPPAHARALTDYRTEVFDRPGVAKLAVEQPEVDRSFALIDRYSVNSKGGMLLVSALDVDALTRASGHDLILVASDRRLVAGGRAEGLTVFDPEAQSAADFDALFTP